MNPKLSYLLQLNPACLEDEKSEYGPKNTSPTVKHVEAVFMLRVQGDFIAFRTANEWSHTRLKSWIKTPFPQQEHWRWVVGGSSLWLSQCLHPNLIENLAELKHQVSKREPRTLKDSETFCREKWAKIPPKLCAKLVTSYKKRFITACQQGFLYRILTYVLPEDWILIYLNKMHNIFQLLCCVFNAFSTDTSTAYWHNQ